MKKLEKTEVKSIDVIQKEIIDSAKYYHVVFFQPGTSNRLAQSFEQLQVAIEYAKVLLSEPNRIRSAMFYAVSEDTRTALCGTMTRNLVWNQLYDKPTNETH